MRPERYLPNCGDTIPGLGDDGRQALLTTFFSSGSLYHLITNNSVSFACEQVSFSVRAKQEPFNAKVSLVFNPDLILCKGRTYRQCDQIGQFIGLWANFQSLWQQLICPNLLPFLGNFCKGVNIIHFSSEIIFGQLLLKFGNFYLVTLLTVTILFDCTIIWEGMNDWSLVVSSLN